MLSTMPRNWLKYFNITILQNDLLSSVCWANWNDLHIYSDQLKRNKYVIHLFIFTFTLRLSVSMKESFPSLTSYFTDSINKKCLSGLTYGLEIRNLNLICVRVKKNQKFHTFFSVFRYFFWKRKYSLWSYLFGTQQSKQRHCRKTTQMLKKDFAKKRKIEANLKKYRTHVK